MREKRAVVSVRVSLRRLTPIRQLSYAPPSPLTSPDATLIKTLPRVVRVVTSGKTVSDARPLAQSGRGVSRRELGSRFVKRAGAFDKNVRGSASKPEPRAPQHAERTPPVTR